MADLTPTLGITVDCTYARELAEFWCDALGYVMAPPPAGWADWESFLRDHDVPQEEWDDGAAIRPASGDGPSISFLKVPEGKMVKNRVHLDVKVSGGRDVEQLLRETRIREAEARLVARGARRHGEHRVDGRLDHLVMQDPEGNEFCIV